MTEKARRFRALHVPGDPLVLVNCWDPVSARITVQAGAAAVATTSAGVSWALGATDGGGLERDVALEALRRVTIAVDVPVTVDLEDGYGADPSEVADVVGQAVRAGVAGLNIEDGRHGEAVRLRSIVDQVERLTAARAAAPDVFLNARIDTFLTGEGSERQRITETLRRATAYLAAGADGLFVPGAVNRGTITELTGAIPAPVNIMVWPGAPTVSELAKLGVARVSTGASAPHAAYNLVWRAAREVLHDGHYEMLATDETAIDVNALMTARR